MTTTMWRGGQAATRQIDTIVLSGTWTSTDTVLLTIANVSMTTTIGSSTTAAQVAALVQQAFVGTNPFTDTTASSTIANTDGGYVSAPMFSELTAANPSGGTLTFTGALAGKPFTMTSSRTTGSSGAISSDSTTTTVVGPNHANVAANFSANATVANNDVLVFDSGSVDMLYNLSLGVQVATLTKYMAYTGKVGLNATDKDTSSKPYPQYRTRYLTGSNNSVTTTANLEVGDGPGSSRFMYDAGAGRIDYNVFGKGQREDTAIPCLLLKTTHVSSTLSNLAGDVGIAFFGGETSTLATVVNGDGPTSGAKTYLGSGVTLTTVRVVGGYLTSNSAITTATQYNGQWDHYSGTITTLTQDGGVMYIHGACTITNCTVYGTLDLSKSSGTVTFTNKVTLDGNGTINDPNGKATFSAGYILNSATAKVIRPVGDTHSLS